MKHEDYIEQIYALIDNLLTPEEDEEIREHISKCESCSALYGSVVSDDSGLKEELDTLTGKADFRERLLKSAERLKQDEKETRLRFSITDLIRSRGFAYAAVTLVVFATAFVVGFSYLREHTSRFGHIAKLNGLAWCKRGDSQFMLSSGDLIKCEDEVLTENGSKIHVLTVDNHIITLNSNTHIAIGESNRERQRIGLIRGEIFVDSNDTGRKYSIKTPDSEIRNTGTKFDVRVMPKQLIPSIVYVAVESGRAVVKAKDENIHVVKPREKVILVEGRAAKFEKETPLEQTVKWRWNLKDLLAERPKILWKEEDPFTGRTWVSSGRHFAMPEDREAEEYDVLLKLLIAMRQRFGRSIEATSVTFAKDYIYFGSSSGIFRYNREPKTISLIVPDYGIIGSDITKITISESGDVFDISFRRPGSNLVERLTMNADSFPMILNFDPLTLKPVASAK